MTFGNEADQKHANEGVTGALKTLLNADSQKNNVSEAESQLVHALGDWRGELRSELVSALGEQRANQLYARFVSCLPVSYIEQVDAKVAAKDVSLLDSLDEDNDARALFFKSRRESGTLHFKIYRIGESVSLSDVLPKLEHLGLRVISESVHDLELDGEWLSIQDFQVQSIQAMPFTVEEVADYLQETFDNLWHNRAESDRFNRLVLGAMLDWRSIAMLRGYCKYLQQVGVPFSQQYMEETLSRYPVLTRLLTELFKARFDPALEQYSKEQHDQDSQRLRHMAEELASDKLKADNPKLVDQIAHCLDGSREERESAIVGTINVLIDNVSSLDDERIIKSYLDTIKATTRTSYYQTFDGKTRSYISYKFDSEKVPYTPKPVPYREIWVYSPRVEAVHLRFGQVARGGLRWSDRREDFRTEVLGLVKAQMVKNTVIVPVGSKGGFFVKQSPDPSEREAWLAEGKACYQLFIQGMLDITDNLVDDKVVPAPDVVRHDGDDTYLVVAADKGTAKFSDLANSISTEHNYWLDDAFASGGSHGYDHKEMGITAKGAWESVKRHFRSLGIDCQNEPFTCVGIGDMSGDVFGNGLLRSEHTRLIAAFDHRDIFIDPDPDEKTGFAERKRLFELPRSTWQDYDTSLISKGGGVFSRKAKSIQITPEIRTALGLADDVEHLTPDEMIQAALCAPVDLLYNGGIGTYVKASTETQAEVGDRANASVRVDGANLRCRIIGEGGNLGFTQKGRVEAALQGIVNNTDFIDNSGGVDSSDHEVNIKILLSDAVRRGELDFDARNKQLAVMTNDIEHLVLKNNYRQNQALTLMEGMLPARQGSMMHFIHVLESEGLLDREVMALPSNTEMRARNQQKQGLVRPELAVLLSYDKIRLFDQLLDSDIPEDAYISRQLVQYFPEALRERYTEHMQRHRLEREIIATAVTNAVINRMGATFVFRLQEDTGKSASEVVKAFVSAREILEAGKLWEAIEALDNKVSEASQLEATLGIWSLLRHMTRGLLSQSDDQGLDVLTTVERYSQGIKSLRKLFPDVLSPSLHEAYAADMEKWLDAGFDKALAHELATLPAMRAAIDMVVVSTKGHHSIDRVAHSFFGLSEKLELEQLRLKVEALIVTGKWHAAARGSLLDDLNRYHKKLVINVLSSPEASKAEAPVEAWFDQDNADQARAVDSLANIMLNSIDYPMAWMAVRQLLKLAQVN